MNKKILCCLVSAFVAPLSQPALAFPNILSVWGDLYPNSSSDDTGCQLCHANVSGGEPWNAYGWEIKQELSGTPGDAIVDVQFFDQDLDPLQIESFDEIKFGFQPGWTAGALNTLYCDDDLAACGGQATLDNQSPPASIAANELDFPTPINDPIPSGFASSSVTLDLEEIATGFNAPVRAVKAPGISGSLFVVEQTGRIWRVDLTTGDKTLFHNVANDLVSISSSYDERGLLGLAFHPDYAQNGLFYTYQSEPIRSNQDSVVDFSVTSSLPFNHRSMVTEYRATDPSCNSGISKRKVLMIIDQPQSNHNGGDLVFDQNNHLYVSLGDGGGADDVGPGHGEFGNGRDANNVLGTILRIDPLGNNSANGKYGVPNDNPFLGSAEVDEVFAFGFRNPYRMSFDADTGELYTGDVGQSDSEEVDIVTSGGNYGWNWKEGSFFFHNPSTLSSYVSTTAPPDLPSNLIDPVGEYDHDEGISITGGYVYRGNTLSQINGHYIFGDFSGPSFGTPTGRLLSLNVSSSEIKEFPLTNPINGYITGFGQDADQELYVVLNDQFNPSGQAGRLMKLVESGDISAPPSVVGESAICPPSVDMCWPIVTESGAIASLCL